MNLSDLARNANMLRRSLAKKGYMRWWHSFSGTQPETGETRTFFVEFFIVNPRRGGSGLEFLEGGNGPEYIVTEGDEGNGAGN